MVKAIRLVFTSGHIKLRLLYGVYDWHIPKIHQYVPKRLSKANIVVY